MRVSINKWRDERKNNNKETKEVLVLMGLLRGNNEATATVLILHQ